MKSVRFFRSVASCVIMVWFLESGVISYFLSFCMFEEKGRGKKDHAGVPGAFFMSLEKFGFFYYPLFFSHFLERRKVEGFSRFSIFSILLLVFLSSFTYYDVFVYLISHRHLPGSISFVFLVFG